MPKGPQTHLFKDPKWSRCAVLLVRNSICELSRGLVQSMTSYNIWEILSVASIWGRLAIASFSCRDCMLDQVMSTVHMLVLLTFTMARILRVCVSKARCPVQWLDHGSSSLVNESIQLQIHSWMAFRGRPCYSWELRSWLPCAGSKMSSIRCWLPADIKMTRPVDNGLKPLTHESRWTFPHLRWLIVSVCLRVGKLTTTALSFMR